MSSNLAKSGLKNILYVVAAQMISYFLSMLTSFVLPNFLGVEQFGYWQIYLFYSGYIGLFCLGFNDGIYLRYGSFEYADLPKQKISSSIRVFGTMLIFFTIIINFFLLFVQDASIRFAYQFASFNIVILGFNGFFIMIYQVTNRMKQYSFVTVLDKITMITSILILILYKKDYFEVIVIIDVLSKIIVLLVNAFLCRDILFEKEVTYSEGIKEFNSNIIIGINLMLANLIGMLLLGLGRLIIEHFKSIEEYGLYAFALSSTNLALMFITAVGLVLYPIITRMTDDKKIETFKKLNSIVTILIFGMMFLYFGIYWIINNILKDYIPVLSYLYILFPIVVAQSKLQLVIGTYYNVLRKEKEMLKANILSLIVFILIAVPSFLIFKSISSIAFSTLITLLWRCYTSEIYLKRMMKISSYNNIVEEVVMIFLFMLITKYGEGLIAFSIYIIIFVLYLFIKRSDLKKIFQEFKSLYFMKG